MQSTLKSHNEVVVGEGEHNSENNQGGLLALSDESQCSLLTMPVAGLDSQMFNLEDTTTGIAL